MVKKKKIENRIVTVESKIQSNPIEDLENRDTPIIYTVNIYCV